MSDGVSILELMSEDTYHIPVLLHEAVEGLAIRPDGVYVDATLGGGGHSRAIVERLSPEGHLYGIDQDSDAIAHAFADTRFTAVHGNFRFLANFMRFYGVLGKVDGILADLGVSSHHFDEAERGFSFRADAPLDMRMNRSAAVSAADLIADASEERLADIFKLYGELRQARALARAIVKARGEAPVDTTGRLAAVAEKVLSPASVKKEMAQVFQALRIEVNGEMDALGMFLEASLKTLRPGGRIAVITYHSLEDRLVKNFFRSGRLDGKIESDIFGRTSVPLKALGNKPITPTAEEEATNPRSRSAKLRIAVKNQSSDSLQ